MQESNLNPTPTELLMEIKALLLEKQKPWLNMDEACRLLKIQKNTLYIYTHKKLIPFYKMQNRRIYFKIEDLKDFVFNKKFRSSSKEELEEQALTETVNGKRTFGKGK